MSALTPPIAGAVAKPPDLELRLPFVAGEEVQVTSGYSRSGGSSLHGGVADSCCTNDHYALDFTLPRHEDNGRGQPVLAAAAGTVVKAAWARGGYANFGLWVVLRHDGAQDGHVYFSAYAHLNAVLVQEGERVQAGQALGELGGSCRGVTKCPSFEAHLHFAVYQDALVDDGETGGVRGGRAVVPEPLGGFSVFTPGQRLAAEDLEPPAQVQDACPLATAYPTLLDDRACLVPADADQWTRVALGEGGESRWAPVEVDPRAAWTLGVAESGEYRVAAFLPPDGPPLAARLRYQVAHAGGLAVVEVESSSARDGWVDLGTYALYAGTTYEVRLNAADATQGGQLVADALRVVQQNSLGAGVVDPRLSDPVYGCSCGARGTQGPGPGAWVWLLLAGGLRALGARRARPLATFGAHTRAQVGSSGVRVDHSSHP